MAGIVAASKVKRYSIGALSLCIAAHCREDGRSKIVQCFDSYSGDEYSHGPKIWKCDLELSPTLSVLFAGQTEDTEDALRILKWRFTQSVADLDTCKEMLHVGMQEFLDWRRRNGRTDESKIQLLVSGFLETVPLIVYVDASQVMAFPHFYAIGTGQVIADGILRWRSPYKSMELSEVLYYVYEAKRMGEASPFVNNEITMLVTSFDAGSSVSYNVQRVREETLIVLQEQFEQYGPKLYKPEPLLPSPIAV